MDIYNKYMYLNTSYITCVFKLEKTYCESLPVAQCSSVHCGSGVVVGSNPGKILAVIYFNPNNKTINTCLTVIVKISN